MKAIHSYLFLLSGEFGGIWQNLAVLGGLQSRASLKCVHRRLPKLWRETEKAREGPYGGLLIVVGCHGGRRRGGRMVVSQAQKGGRGETRERERQGERGVRVRKCAKSAILHRDGEK